MAILYFILKNLFYQDLTLNFLALNLAILFYIDFIEMFQLKMIYYHLQSQYILVFRHQTAIFSDVIRSSYYYLSKIYININLHMLQLIMMYQKKI